MERNDLLKLVKEICPKGDWYIFDIHEEDKCLLVGNVKSINEDISNIKISDFMKQICLLKQKGHDVDNKSLYEVFVIYQKILFEEEIKKYGMSVTFAGPNIYIR